MDHWAVVCQDATFVLLHTQEEKACTQSRTFVMQRHLISVLNLITYMQICNKHAPRWDVHIAPTHITNRGWASVGGGEKGWASPSVNLKRSNEDEAINELVSAHVSQISQSCKRFALRGEEPGFRTSGFWKQTPRFSSWARAWIWYKTTLCATDSEDYIPGRHVVVQRSGTSRKWHLCRRQAFQEEPVHGTEPKVRVQTEPEQSWWISSEDQKLTLYISESNKWLQMWQFTINPLDMGCDPEWSWPGTSYGSDAQSSEHKDSYFSIQVDFSSSNSSE